MYVIIFAILIVGKLEIFLDLFDIFRYFSDFSDRFIFGYLCHPEHRVLMFSLTEAALADVDTRGDFQSYFLSFHANL